MKTPEGKESSANVDLPPLHPPACLSHSPVLTSFLATARSLSRFTNAWWRWGAGPAARAGFLLIDLLCLMGVVCCPPLNTACEPVIRWVPGGLLGDPKDFDVTASARSPSPSRTSVPRSALCSESFASTDDRSSICSSRVLYTSSGVFSIPSRWVITLKAYPWSVKNCCRLIE